MEFIVRAAYIAKLTDKSQEWPNGQINSLGKTFSEEIYLNYLYHY